jgi:phosphotransferase system enzyme I (PtsI)
MSTPALVDVRASLLKYTLDEARQLAEIALAADGAAEARAAVTAAALTLKEANS